MKIIYKSEFDQQEFNLDRFYRSLNRYGKVAKEAIEDELENWHYDPMSVTCLNEIAIKLLPNKDSKLAYFEDHKVEGKRFERLRRITGYLVGSLERWNDAKKSEEKARVKHSINSAIDDRETEEARLENSLITQI